MRGSWLILRRALFCGLVGALLLLSACSSTRWGSWTSPTLDEARSQLQGLSFGDYVDVSYRLYLLRTPQTVTELGLSEAFGVRDDRLDDYSPSYLRETEDLEREILAGLLRFDREALTADQRVTYDAAVWMWNDLVSRQDLQFSGFALGSDDQSAQMRLYRRLIADWRIRTVDDIVDYIACLHQAGRQIDQMRSALLLQVKHGVVPPEEVLNRILTQLAPLRVTETFSKSEYLPARIAGGHHPFYLILRARVLSILPTEIQQRVAYLQEALNTLEDEVIPAYERLYKSVAGLLDQIQRGSIVVVPPNEDDYYAWSLRHAIGLDLTPAQIHDAAEADVTRLQGEIRNSLASLPSDLEPVAAPSDEEALEAEYEALMADARRASATVFARIPERGVEIVLSDVGQGYVPAPLGGDAPARLVLGVNPIPPSYEAPALVHREIYPGLHLQLELVRGMNLPLVQTAAEFAGFVDGWGAYAQQLASEIGLYADDPYGKLGLLRDQLRQAALAVVDTGIHSLGWSYQTAMAYYLDVTSDSDDASTLIKAAISRPAVAVSAYVGSAELLELRRAAQDALGAGFDLRAFHRLVLAHGFVPLSVLDSVVRGALVAPSGA